MKIQILNPDTAIAFAGDVATSLNIITGLNAELKANPETSICEGLYEFYERRNRDCEFLILQLTAGANTLAHITDERLSYCERAYIGGR